MIRSLLNALVACVVLLSTAPSMAAELNPTFLPVHDAFKITATETPNAVLLHISPAPGYYLYREKLAFRVIGDGVDIGTPILPPGEQKADPYFGDVVIYHDRLDARLPIRNPEGRSFQLRVGFQGCAEKGLCYPPDFQLIAIAGNAGTGTPIEWRDSSLERSVLSGVAQFFSEPGLILVSMISFLLIRNATAPARGLILGLAFSLGMIPSYIAIAVATGFYGAAFNVLAQVQAAWVSIIIIVILISAATLQMQSKKTDRLHTLGTVVAAAAFGALSSVIVYAWISESLAGAISNIAAGVSLQQAIVQIAGLACGLCAPAIALGVLLSAGMKYIHGRSEALMMVSATSLVVVAIWVSSRLLPEQLVLGLCGGLAAFFASRLGVFMPHAGRSSRSIGALMLSYAAMAWVGMLAGHEFPFNPLMSEVATSSQAKAWTTVQTPSGLSSALAEATTAGIPAIVQWTATWCAICHRTEQEIQTATRSDQSTQAVKLIRVDVTSDGPSQRQLLALSGFLAPPALQVYRGNGVEAVDRRLLGNQSQQKIQAAMNAVTNIQP